MDEFSPSDDTLLNAGVTLADELLAEQWHYGADSKYDDFKWAQYDWSQFDVERFGYYPLRLGSDSSSRRGKQSPLSGVYFSTISPHRVDQVTEGGTKAWYPKVDYERDESGNKTGRLLRIGAYRSEGFRPQHTVHLARFLLGNLRVQADHINTLALDDRDENLRRASARLNLLNQNRVRKQHSELLKGVEWTSQTKKRVQGVIQYVYKGETRKERSPDSWPLEEQHKAHEWYVAQLRRVYGDDFVDEMRAVTVPKFPPLNRRIYLPTGRVHVIHGERDASLLATF